MEEDEFFLFKLIYWHGSDGKKIFLKSVNNTHCIESLFPVQNYPPYIYICVPKISFKPNQGTNKKCFITFFSSRTMAYNMTY